MKNSQNGVKHKNIFSDAFNKQKEDTFYYLDDKIVGKEAIEEKLKEIHSNIEKIGKLCDRKKKTSYEEYNSVWVDYRWSFVCPREIGSVFCL